VPAPALGSWGWRIPFLLALPLGLAALLLRRRTMDTPEFSALLAQQVGRRPGEQFSALGPHRATVTQGFLLAAALMSSFNLWFVFLPAELQQSGTQALSLSLASALLGLLVLAGSAVAWGHLSDRWGRRPVLTAGLALVAVAWLAAYPVAASGSLMSLVLGHVLAGLGLGGLVIQSTICDALPLRVRTAGIAVSVGVASAAVGATAPLVAHELGAVSPLLVPLYAVAWVVGAAACVRPLTRRASELSPREPSSAPARAGKPGPGVDAVVVEQAP
jgi:MHS family proline/betaine transporter-like MFS transporter